MKIHLEKPVLLLGKIQYPYDSIITISYIRP